MRRYAQIPSSIKYFVVLDGSGATVFDASGTVSPMMYNDDARLALIQRSPQPTIATGSLLKDLGRTITKYDICGNTNIIVHTGVYRQVLYVNNYWQEGIDATNNVFYIKVWSPVAGDTELTTVARVGPGPA